jgi:hypothetical protein
MDPIGRGSYILADRVAPEIRRREKQPTARGICIVAVISSQLSSGFGWSSAAE